MFAWQPSDIPGVPREVIEHHLVVCPHAQPVKKKVRKKALERQQFITDEIKKLEAAGLVRGVLHPTWLANPVVVRKANGKWKLCINFTDLNKACPKDPFPLARIDQIVDSTLVVISSLFWMHTLDIIRSSCPRKTKSRPHSSPHVVRIVSCACLSG